MLKKFLSVLLLFAMLVSVSACSADELENELDEEGNENIQSSTSQTSKDEKEEDTATIISDKEGIESSLNLANNEDQEWTYSSNADAWILSVVSAVVNPEIEDEQGVSVCVPGAYITGIDTDGDGTADVTSEDYTETVNGSLVINYDATITNENGQTYTASTAPVILTTGAAGYSEQSNSTASTGYAQYGYVSVACGNRGKQSTAEDEDGNTYYTGDAPLCLVDQKAATRYVKYNILLGNLPGSVDYYVTTGGSGGGAHAAMFAATSNNSDYYDYQIEAGAVGVYEKSDGTYSTTVTIDGEEVELSDGAWGTVAYSAITSLEEANMAQAFEYYIDTTYEFNTSFQEQLAEYLSETYMNYINDQNLSVDESTVGFDLNSDGDTDDTIALTIEYDLAAYPETNGYYGTYLDLYLAEFTENLQWYLDNLDYAESWTWFDESGNAMSDTEVAQMTAEEKAEAFIEGRYSKSSSSSSIDSENELPNVDLALTTYSEDSEASISTLIASSETFEIIEVIDDDVTDLFGDDVRDGGPDEDTTASSDSTTDSSNYETYEEMVEAYAADIEEIEAGDKYGNNIVSLYNPINYIGAESTEDPTWTRIVMGAVEGDISMFCSLNLEIAWLNAGVDCVIEWQWDGGHVPSEVLGNSLALYVDEMYAKYAGGNEVEKEEALVQTSNGTASSATGTDLSSWVDYSDVTSVSFTLSDILVYRNSGASKAVPGFDTIDYNQEDYEFGSSTQDARHWDSRLLEIFQNEEYAAVLSELFNVG